MRTGSKHDIKDERIDGGKAFDWGRACSISARARAFCLATCTLRRKMDGDGHIPEQIEQAKKLSQGIDIGYYAMPAEKIDFPDASFDAATACRCFWYFDHEKLIPQLCRMLKSNGRLLVLCMEWLPFEDKIAGMSEDLVLRYSPDWSGAGETMHPIEIPACYKEKFELVHHEEWKLKVHFTRESWNGRTKACRGIGASLTPEELDVLHFAAMAELRKKD